jgi:hypothetical protein
MAKASRRPQATSATIHAQKLERGEGGELHQVATGDMAVLTTAQGGPISDDQNSLKVGERGPTVLEDFHFREKIFHYHHSGRARAHLASLMQISGPSLLREGGLNGQPAPPCDRADHQLSRTC